MVLCWLNSRSEKENRQRNHIPLFQCMPGKNVLLHFPSSKMSTIPAVLTAFAIKMTCGGVLGVHDVHFAGECTVLITWWWIPVYYWLRSLSRWYRSYLFGDVPVIIYFGLECITLCTNRKQLLPIRILIVLLDPTFYQYCGAATFLGGSGSGSPRFRSRLRLRPKLGRLRFKAKKGGSGSIH